ncbi:hypothetical protein [Mycobacterium sp. 852002-40037_SCH5390672]|nr:hypothetical protein [Mycobacterium sp. 852002-40037_SCH5390672]
METTTDSLGERATEITAAFLRSPNDGVLGARKAANHSTTQTSPGR